MDNKDKQASGDLTDEQIDALMIKSSIMDQRWPMEKQYRAFARAAIAAHLASQSQAAQPSEPTDIARRLRSCATGPMQNQDHAKLMATAADECDRFYGGMMNWKASAQAKDRTIIELRTHLAGQSQATRAVPEVVREAIEAAFEDREGWRTKIAAAVRVIGDPTAQEATQQAAQPSDSAVETEMADRLRRIVLNRGEGPINVQSKLLIQAADECDRFYNGMMNWKANAQSKDRTIIELRAHLAPTTSTASAPPEPSKPQSAPNSAPESSESDSGRAPAVNADALSAEEQAALDRLDKPEWRAASHLKLRAVLAVEVARTIRMGARIENLQDELATARADKAPAADAAALTGEPYRVEQGGNTGIWKGKRLIATINGRCFRSDSAEREEAEKIVAALNRAPATSAAALRTTSGKGEAA